MSDPKGAVGAAKLPFATLPWAVISEMALGHGEGAEKYGPHNWRDSGGVCANTYRAAAFRHLAADMLGEEIDPDSGVPHIVKAMCSLAVLRDARIHGCAIEDGPPPSRPDLLAGLTAQWGVTRAQAQALAGATRAVATPAAGACTVCGGRGRVPSPRHDGLMVRRCPACTTDPHDVLNRPPSGRSALPHRALRPRPTGVSTVPADE